MDNKDLYKEFVFTYPKLLKDKIFIFKDNICYNAFLNTLLETKESFLLYSENRGSHFLYKGFFLITYKNFYIFIKKNIIIPFDFLYFLENSDIFKYEKNINKIEEFNYPTNSTNNLDSLKNIKYYENDNYYFGSFSNGLRNGKGRLYYFNGKIKYEGFFKNDQKYGYGKLIYEINENDDYYVGQFFNNLKNGKGIIYDKKHNLKYEGDFVNDKPEGNGKLIYENGSYYIGQFPNGLRHGRGTEYKRYHQIIFDGNFINDQKQR